MVVGRWGGGWWWWWQRFASDGIELVVVVKWVIDCWLLVVG